MNVALAVPGDVPFLRVMAFEAMYWEPEAAPASIDEAFADEHLARYVEGWGRRGDAAVIAREGAEPLGAAWFRLFAADRRGYGFLDERTPELGLAVTERHRRRGIGRELLRAIVAEAGREGHDAVSLSVSERNLAAIHLYEEIGFERVALDGDSWTMALRLG